MLSLGGAVLFAIVTVLQELCIRHTDAVEYLGLLGLFGSIVSGMQMYMCLFNTPIVNMQQINLTGWYWKSKHCSPLLGETLAHCCRLFRPANSYFARYRQSFCSIWVPQRYTFLSCQGIFIRSSLEFSFLNSRYVSLSKVDFLYCLYFALI